MRLKQYTERGLSRLACFRCDTKPARFQWRLAACAAGNDKRWRPVCLSCDLELNEMILQWANVPNWQALMDEYRAANG